jgi:hypothetical protein
MIIRAQSTKGSRRGSWDPDGYWASNYAGRVYSTTLMCLTLEVYYRYLPMYESQESLRVGEGLVQQIRDEKGGARKVALLRKLVLFNDPAIPAILNELLEDENPSVRFTAAKHLAERGDPKAIPFLQTGLRHQNPFYRFNAIRALEELDHPDTVPALIIALEDDLAQNADRAAQSLRKKTGVSFGFKGDAPLDEKRKIIASWKTWWDNNRERLGSMPDIRGEVVAARAGGAKVLVKVPEDAPVVKDMRFRVFRSGKLVGHVRVTEVLRGGMIEASVASWELPDSAIAKGDLIGTRDPPEGDTH